MHSYSFYQDMIEEANKERKAKGQPLMNLLEAMEMHDRCLNETISIMNELEENGVLYVFFIENTKEKTSCYIR